MPCNITSGRLEKCSEQRGGYKKIGIAEFNEYLATVQTVSGFGSISIDWIDSNNTPSEAPTWYEFELIGESHSVDENGVKSREGGTAFFETAGTFVLHNLRALDREVLGNLQKAARVHLWVEDYNGKRRLFGLRNGIDINITSNSGTAFGDLNGYTVTFSGKEKNLAPFDSEQIGGIPLKSTWVPIYGD